MICYSNATVPSSSHAVKSLIRFFRVTSAGFWSWFCKLVLFDTVISGQSLLFITMLPNKKGQSRGEEQHERKTGDGEQRTDLGFRVVVSWNTSWCPLSLSHCLLIELLQGRSLLDACKRLDPVRPMDLGVGLPETRSCSRPILVNRRRCSSVLVANIPSTLRCQLSPYWRLRKLLFEELEIFPSGQRFR